MVVTREGFGDSGSANVGEAEEKPTSKQPTVHVS